MRVVFDSDRPLRFTQLEPVRYKRYNGPDEILSMPVADFGSFDDVHRALETADVTNQIWWENGNELFRDADAYVTVSR